ncbi:hypothetical protein HHL22_22745 [Hymenobacter sp. RP-2-7]|uniref:Coproporphyrinogen III oxidase n=1 Tax=Hymenobacter polaris TaxID=2682546 RepID=A0A7Y0FPX6_9BACT|nr:hypothetical protein [Hymenobacter polaris]NML68026.1 hypothetical protein [Hymenobacter polaris]
MKIFQLALAAGLLSCSAAFAQTTPGTTVPSTPGPAGTASPSAVPSGMAAPTPDPKGNVTPSEAFTKGSPNSDARSDRRMKRKKMKDTMPNGKMKTNM